ncbi:pilus assembly protein TadG-related protein [Streptomyces sp. FBKL.4005]|uniref:pilus assembly protein TadG-related protein n=1 Tax=Streptomyces TaxID=1883 RepID=UPI001CB8EDF0|nr:pilus assembly protein TadG-related protein [Streptomyces sp. FBKL.4005]
MRYRQRRSDTGQAFPIYITVVAGLLFLALAYLAVGQAAVNRSGAQTAADAAALAAAQSRRDHLASQWLATVTDPAEWEDIFDGKVDLNPACLRADQLAAQNDGQVQTCDDSRPLDITVQVRTNKRVGDSIVPGVEDIQSIQSATAVIEPLCTFDVPSGEAEDAPLPELTCDGTVWKPDPADPEGLPEPQDLFDVHLADRQANHE